MSEISKKAGLSNFTQITHDVHSARFRCGNKSESSSKTFSWITDENTKEIMSEFFFEKISVKRNTLEDVCP